jgi:hypothetical protein
MPEFKARRIPGAAARRTGVATLGLVACGALAALVRAPSAAATTPLEVYVACRDTRTSCCHRTGRASHSSGPTRTHAV